MTTTETIKVISDYRENYTTNIYNSACKCKNCKSSLTIKLVGLDFNPILCGKCFSLTMIGHTGCVPKGDTPCEEGKHTIETLSMKPDKLNGVQIVLKWCIKCGEAC